MLWALNLFPSKNVEKVAKYQVWILLDTILCGNKIWPLAGDHWKLAVWLMRCIWSKPCSPLWSTVDTVDHYGQPTVHRRLLWPIQCSHWTGHHHHWSTSISFNFTTFRYSYFPSNISIHQTCLNLTLLSGFSSQSWMWYFDANKMKRGIVKALGMIFVNFYILDKTLPKTHLVILIMSHIKILGILVVSSKNDTCFQFWY